MKTACQTEPLICKKMSISAYRVLYVLKILVKNQAFSYYELNEELLYNQNINKYFDGPTITKYINTLRHAGCSIPKPNVSKQFRYELLKTPFPIIISDNEKNVLIKINQILKRFSDKKLYNQFQQLLKKVNWSCHTEFRIETLESVQTTQEKVINNKFERIAIYLLKGGVSKKYIPYNYETVIKTNKKGTYIRARTCDVDELLNRLMGYGYYCEVVYPSSFRKRIIKRLETLIDILESA